MPDDTTITASSTTMQAPAQPSRTPTIDEVVQRVGHLRLTTRLSGDAVEEAGRRIGEASRRIGEVHHQITDEQLNRRARDIAKRPAAELLNEIARQGFAWRDIARLIGVTVPAVRRWRQGDPPSGARLLAIARIVALTDTLRVDHLVHDVASWMEMPLTPEAPVTGIDLAASGRIADLLDLAGEQVIPEDVLDRWQPGWRSRYKSDFEIFEAADGELGIRLVPDEDG